MANVTAIESFVRGLTKARPLGITSVAEFGAVGSGSDETNQIQAAFDAVLAAGSGVVYFPPGTYQVNGTAKRQKTGIALEGASNIWIVGNGATITQGNAGQRTLGIYGCTHVRISGLRFVGNTTLAGNSTMEHSAAIVVANNCAFVTIEDCYITNYLGDCIFVGGDIDNGVDPDKVSRHIRITGCTLKERYGDGTRIYDSVPGVKGSRSRLAIAVIDAVGVTIAGNHIFGGVDLEPNAAGQRIGDCSIENNRFAWGPVTADGAFPTPVKNWDEPLVDESSGGTKIDGGIGMSGPPAVNIVVFGNVFRSNSIDRGGISLGNTCPAEVVGNEFREGLITAGGVGGSAADLAEATFRGNHAHLVFPTSESAFIKIGTNVRFCTFTGNQVDQQSKFIINKTAPGLTDQRCAYLGNVNTSSASGSGGGTLGFTPNVGSVAADNYYL